MGLINKTNIITINISKSNQFALRLGMGELDTEL